MTVLVKEVDGTQIKENTIDTPGDATTVRELFERSGLATKGQSVSVDGRRATADTVLRDKSQVLVTVEPQFG